MKKENNVIPINKIKDLKDQFLESANSFINDKDERSITGFLILTMNDNDFSYHLKANKNLDMVGILEKIKFSLNLLDLQQE